jgi:hypothetical protein
MTADPDTRRGSKTDPRLASFLEGMSPVVVELARWPSGDEYELISYFTPLMPPVDLVMSVRGVVVRDRSVLVYDDDVGPHIIPGGRVEPVRPHW